MTTLGTFFEAEIREQPAVWRRLARTDAAQTLADALRGREVVVFLGSGSSLFVAQLAAQAFHKRGLRAVAIASSEAAFHAEAYRGVCVVALSQSGRSADVLDAIDLLEPTVLVTLTNDPTSPLAERAHVAIAMGAGREYAIPATKSVSTMHALVLWAVALLASEQQGADELRHTADRVEAFLAEFHADRAFHIAAAEIARCTSVVFVGAGYGASVASEFALKLKEAAYLHGEGFAAGEFRHGSTAVLDPNTALVAIVDDASRAIATRPLAQAEASGTRRYAIGGTIPGVPLLGPLASEHFATLPWLVVGQMLALAVGRARGIDGDAPRGLTKIVGR